MKKFGCLFALLIVAWLCLELWVYTLVSDWVGVQFFGSKLSGYLPVAVAIIVCLFIGIKVAKWHASRVMAGLLTGTAGKHAVGAVAGALLAMPGVLFKVPALILMIPLTQRLLGATAATILGAVVRRQMAAMMGGGKGGFPGAGFPGAGFPGGGFPFPGRADDRVPFPGMKARPKTIDTTAERP
jgi:hypothetical protein